VSNHAEQLDRLEPAGGKVCLPSAAYYRYEVDHVQLRDKKMGNAYVIGHITVKDKEKWNEYRSQVPATLEPWGAELVFRGKRAAVLAGEHPHTDTVVIRFPDLNSIESWYSSPAYQALVPLRESAADLVLLSCEAL
jgi:uncharacterized protein (DUF1330 family)